AGEKPEDLLQYRPQALYDLSTAEAIRDAQINSNLHLMRQLAQKQLYKEKWGGQSKITPTTTNDNRTMTFNIYGVDGADDLQNRLMTIIDNNVNPTTGWAQ
ncbi:MAG: hypothetical protein NC548_55320, partial [Lachnospiraceae bacterium]|nr:hypothetical protein [Lachnospiraceae bacterium]